MRVSLPPAPWCEVHVREKSFLLGGSVCPCDEVSNFLSFANSSSKLFKLTRRILRPGARNSTAVLLRFLNSIFSTFFAALVAVSCPLIPLVGDKNRSRNGDPVRHVGQGRQSLHAGPPERGAGDAGNCGQRGEVHCAGLARWCACLVLVHP